MADTKRHQSGQTHRFVRIAVPILTASTLILGLVSARTTYLHAIDGERRMQQEIEERHDEQAAQIRAWSAEMAERTLRYGEQLGAMLPAPGDYRTVARLPSQSSLPGLQGVVLFRNWKRIHPAFPAASRPQSKMGEFELAQILRRERELARGPSADALLAAHHEEATRLLFHPVFSPGPGAAARFALQERELLGGRRGETAARILEQDSLLRIQAGHALVANLLARDVAELIGERLRDPARTFAVLPEHVLLIAERGPAQIVAIFDREPFFAAFLDDLKPRRASWRNARMSLRAGDGWILRSGASPDRRSALETVFEPGTAPVSMLLSHMPPSRVLRADARRVAAVQCGLLFCALLTLFVALFAVLRAIRGDSRLILMKSNFLNAVSHELKTPLTSIRMFADTLASGRLKTPEKSLEYAQRIQRESIRLEQLVEAVLCYNRLERGIAGGEMEELDLAERCREAVERLLPIAIGKNVSLNYSSTGEVKIFGDRRSIDSLVGNLVDNAIKYTLPGGSVEVSAETRAGAPTFVVSDTGIGIPEEEQGKVFDAFYRVGDEMTRSAAGSGLGLAIVRESVELHKAHLSLHSVPGKGTVFTIVFRSAENGEGTDRR